jgi:rod shape-determining protein MreB
MLLGVTRIFSDDIAIDLGTANTLLHVVGRGIIIDEPSVVAVKSSNGLREVLAVGQRAKMMAGRPLEPIETIRPLRDGVVADFLAAEEMLRRFIRRAKTMLGFRRPRIVICVPASATPVERRAVYEAAVSAGSRRVYLIEESVAAALGAGLAIDTPSARMVVDIGGGTTNIAVLSLGGVVQARSLRVAGNAMDEAIIRYVRRKHQLLISEDNAEHIKIEAGTAVVDCNGQSVAAQIRGRDLRHDQAKTVVLGPRDIAEALRSPIEELTEFIQLSLEELPCKMSAEICQNGICLTGGGALLDGLDTVLGCRLGVQFILPETPMHCVIKGAAAVLEGLAQHEHLLINP